jgi:hypothetical protein
LKSRKFQGVTFVALLFTGCGRNLCILWTQALSLSKMDGKIITEDECSTAVWKLEEARRSQQTIDGSIEAVTPIR